MFYHYEGKLTHHLSYIKMEIRALVELSEYSRQRPFEQLTKEDVLSFLYKFRKTEDRDPLHKWMVRIT